MQLNINKPRYYNSGVVPPRETGRKELYTHLYIL